VVPHFTVNGSVEGLPDEGRRRGVVVGGLGRDLRVDVGVEIGDLSRLTLGIPPEDGCDDGRDRLGGPLPPVRGLVVQPHPSLKDVVEVDGPLRGSRVVGFDAQVSFGTVQRLTEFGILIDEVEQILDEGAVAADESFDAVLVPAVLLRDPGLAASQRTHSLGTEQRHGFGE
jgi:hypothetical protein